METDTAKTRLAAARNQHLNGNRRSYDQARSSELREQLTPTACTPCYPVTPFLIRLPPLLDNELVSVEDEEEYVLRLERYLNISYVNWTFDVEQWPKGKFGEGEEGRREGGGRRPADTLTRACVRPLPAYLYHSLTPRYYPLTPSPLPTTSSLPPAEFRKGFRRKVRAGMGGGGR